VNAILKVASANDQVLAGQVCAVVFGWEGVWQFG